ncbi:Aspartate/glutamate/uridylate kinase [Dunaliella salina]|uniref:Aspartate/glutamate/uridylate kinase n=1 Tax=Dunaliella salina TaxID=3046 RepID=A0ABQ7G9P1_DUNSA|nr:Aspartate/glutamate/uridylate kinase [Dunaliella salina]|eukprot:KAF5831323.1 Aspartate/glutamate/uridylate kinase [Dunaliella salina]
MRFYDDFLSSLGLVCAQVLLTLDNLSDREQFLNARNTFAELLTYNVVPIVNENDTVAVRELRFGDNDTLSAQVATLVEADWLFLMTDVDCLYTANPKDDPNAQPISDVEDFAHLNADTKTKGTQWGTGGMATKLTAGRIAVAAGCTMAGRGQKRWLLMVPLRGSLQLDVGAVRAVQMHKKSLFAAGIVRVDGDFAAHDAVSLLDEQGIEFGRGLVNYSADELERVKGKAAKEFERELGYNGPDEVVHRENLAMLTDPHCMHEEDEH